MGLIALGGTTFGLAEETMAFYPMPIPVFLEAGYDTMTVVATISTLGTLGSTINPFSTVIASNTAGVNFARALPLRIIMLLVSLGAGMLYTIIYAEKVRKDPSKSLVYDQYEENKKKFLAFDSQADKGDFTWRQKLTLLTFVAGFLVMIWGVQSQGWYFTKIAVVFLAVSYLLFLVSSLSEHRFFVSSAADLLGVALTVGLARAVSRKPHQRHDHVLLQQADHRHEQAGFRLGPLLDLHRPRLLHPVIIWSGCPGHADHGAAAPSWPDLDVPGYGQYRL